MSFTVGSLFDGSGGFPLAAFMCGGVPVWASEIEPYPIAVTKSRFPYVKHLGSVTDIKGNEVEPVDVVTFGAPCQDLSVAGLRKGIKHVDNGDEETTRSGLFMDAVRIIKEMREATNGKYPRFAIYENVPGAFSSSKGEDWRTVLEELIKIVEPTAVVPSVPKNGWPYADNYCGDGWSIAYRVFDAQHWGVPQRRRRIYLVLDLGGQCAGEVLFERQGLRGYFETGRTPWQTTPGDATDCAGTADCEGNGVSYGWPLGFRPENTRVYEETATTLCNGTRPGFTCGVIEAVAYSFDSLASNSMKSSNPYSGCRQVEVAKTLDCFDPNPAKNQGGIAILEPVAYSVQDRAGCPGGGKGMLVQENRATSLRTANYQYIFQPVVDGHILDDQGGSQISVREDGKCPTLRAEAHGNVPCVLESAGFKELNSAKARSDAYEHEIAPCLPANKHDVCACVGVLASSAVNAEHTDGEISPCLMARAGTGGNQLPLVALAYDARGNGDGAIAPTITGDHNNRVTDYTCVCCEPTVAYCIGNGQVNDAVQTEKEICKTLNCMDDPMKVLIEESSVTGVDARNATEYPEMTGALQADAAHNLNSNNVVRVKYIVRRLTPTECARLQGFPDDWAHPDEKSEFTDEEYEFWLNVRNTHAEINGKAVKDYTKDQMLTWYNKLHTDSAEYKLWGNGIALPNALYVMQGIADVLN